MKKIIFIISLLLCVSFNSEAQVRACGHFDGYWSDWVNLDAEIKGNYDGFIIYLPKEGPWEYRFKFNINNMQFPSKKQRKQDIKNDKWYEFSGTVEYYITDNYPTIIQLFRAAKGPMFAPAKLDNGRPTKKVTKRATIKIAPFKDRPKTYYIWFENVGFGINLNDTYFPGVEYK